MSRMHGLGTLVLAGSLSGLVVLGVGGRALMRALSYATTEGPRSTLVGTVEVIVVGAVWGGITGPLLRLVRGGIDGNRVAAGVIHGIVVLGVAVVAFLMVTGGGGQIVAPPPFIVLSIVAFPLLFVLHGVVCRWLAMRWIRR